MEVFAEEDCGDFGFDGANGLQNSRIFNHYDLEILHVVSRRRPRGGLDNLLKLLFGHRPVGVVGHSCRVPFLHKIKNALHCDP